MRSLDIHSSWHEPCRRHRLAHLCDCLLGSVLRLCRHRRPRALVFHRITHQYSPSSWGSQFPLQAFERLLDAITASGMSAVSLGDLHQRLADGGDRRCRDLIGISFDDGTSDTYLNAFPLLRERGMSATIFVTTSLIGSRRPPIPWEGSDGDVVGLLEEQIVEMHKAGIEIGSHGVNHYELDAIPVDQARHEMLESKRRIESLVGATVRTFGYPHGAFDCKVVDLAQSLGYVSAWTYEPRTLGKDCAAHAMPRFSVHANMAGEATCLLHGGHWTSTVKTRLLGRACVASVPVRKGRACQC